MRHRPPLRPALAGLAVLWLPALAARAQGGATVSGVVFDSLARVPLAGAMVQLVPHPATPRGAVASYSATASSGGAYHIDGVGSGRYLASFFHPTLDSLGLEAPLRGVTVDGGAVRADLAVPSARAIVATLCRARAPTDSLGLLLGYVRDADTGAPLAGGTVTVYWNEIVIDEKGLRHQRRQLSAATAPNGWYLVCDIPADGEVVARAAHGADSSGAVELRVPPRGLLVRDFGIGSAGAVAVVPVDSGRRADQRRPGITVRRGTARLTGTVRSPEGRPLTDAKVIVWGTGVEGVTGDSGTFALAGLPAGTFSLEVRYIGYAPKRVAVNLSSNKTATAAVALEDRAAVLSVVQVLGKRTRPLHDMTGFLDRMRRGGGFYFTREQIEERHAWRTSDLLRTVPGVRVVPTWGSGYTLLMRGDCRPAVYLDGRRISISGAADPLTGLDDVDMWTRPEEIIAMEIYTSDAGAPAQYRGNGCGSVLVWTGPRLK